MAQGRLPTLDEWLNTLDLQQYRNSLVNVGLCTVEQIQDFGLDDSFLNDIGISLIGHRKRILENIPTAAMIPTPEMTPQSESIYANISNLSPHKYDMTEGDDIYVNYSIPTSSDENVPLRSPENRGTCELNKKPIPRPRLSKLKKQQKKELLQQQTVDVLANIPQSPPPVATLENIPQSPSPVASPRKHGKTNSVFKLPGVTEGESVCDTEDLDPFAVRRSLKGNVTPTNKFSDELFNVLNVKNFDQMAVRPTGFSDNFQENDNNNRLSDHYDAIWADSDSAQTSKESHQRKASYLSPYTPPCLPKPCNANTFDFKKEEPREKMGDDMESSIYEPVVNDRDKMKKRTPQKHVYVNDKVTNSESPPPPSFPPPSLPPEEGVLPPVPPRTSSIPNNTLINSNSKPTDSELYSDQYVQKGLFTSTTMKTLMSTSGPDPFNGDDPFPDFESDCKSFNEPGSVNIFSPEDPSRESTFDPFGIVKKQEQSTSRVALEQVPPAPEWHSIVQTPGADIDIYSLATSLPQDSSSDNNISEGNISDPSSFDDFPQPPYEAGAIIPPINILDFPLKGRPKQKSGYLFKQGGVNANRGWKKRWIVFDGYKLRYYHDNKSQISIKVIPVACMQRVEICKQVKNGDKFKFYLINQNRTFLFAADTLNECTLWANTLMEAIITKPKGGEKEGGDMFSPDKMGFVKFERMGDKFVAIKSGKLCYYDSHMDYKIASPVNEINLKMASVKDVGKNRLQLSTHYGHYMLLFTDKQDCVFWKMAIEEAIADALGDNTILDNVRENQSNHYCADCGERDPHWASINIGIVLCKNCAGIHREFDPNVSRVKSLRMDTTIWTPSLIEMMKAIGNENSKKFWEFKLQPISKITTDTPVEHRKQFIQEKYDKKLWINQHSLVSELNEKLLRTVVTDDILQTMSIVFSGANVLYTHKSTGKTAFELAKEEGQRLQTEFLYLNGGDKNFRTSDVNDEEFTLRLRAVITMEGHLLKTGPMNRNVFKKRYCVIEHCCLRYFENEKSALAKDSIDSENMLCIQSVINIEKPCRRHTVYLDKLFQNIAHISSKSEAVRDDRYPNTFELSTTKSNNRTYLFAATTPEEKMAWMRTLTKLFCPPHYIKEMDNKEFSIAGNFYVKAGVASEWKKTWLFVDKKVVYYINEQELELQEIDLRKGSNIQYVDYVAGQPCSYAVQSGKSFILDIPGRSFYFQADIIRDTERLYEAFGSSMKGGGATIEDQQLTSENVPVIVDKCIKFIEEHGLREEGIYRQAAQESRIQSLLSRFLSDAHSLVLRVDTHTVNEVANCLKRFFRQLKDPLFTRAGYLDWIKCPGRDGNEAKLAFYKSQLNKLPQVNFCTVRMLVLHLASLSLNAAETKMDIKNIALTFGSTLVRGGAELIQKENLQLEMKIVEDLVTNHSVLFKEEVQKQQDSQHNEQLMRDKIQNAEQERLSVITSIQVNSIKVTIYYQHRSCQSADYDARRGETVADAIAEMKKKFKLSLGQWVLYEVVYSDVLERPLHPSECLLDVVMSWCNWNEKYRKEAHLVLKSAERLIELDEVFDPKHALFAEFEYKEKKDKFRKFPFGFNQSKLSLFKDSRYNAEPLVSWKIEDIIIYFGADPKKNAQKLSKSPNLKFAFSFIVKDEIIGNKDMPLFGRTVCCTTKEEYRSWMAAMLKAKYPDGYMIS